jgi:carbon monoxide dehydrogenase subunit G
VTRFEPPKRIVLEGRGMNLHAIDDIRFDATGTGTRVQYRADFRFLGSMRWAETIMKPAFNRIAERAMNGMKEALSRRAA